jgi:putative peptidoglycan lipid II flippase
MLVGQTVLLLLQQPRLDRALRGMVLLAPGVKQRLHTVMLPLGLAAVLQQMCVVGEKYFGSLLEAGSIAFLSFGFRIATIPLSLYSLSFLSVVYPSLAERRAGIEQFVRGSLAYRAFATCLFILVPASTVLMVYSVSVVRILFGRGAFGTEQVASTAPLLAIYSAGVPAMGVALLAGRMLLAQGRGGVFITATVGVTVSTLVLDYLLYERLGAAGLALALTVGSWAQAVFTVLSVCAGGSCRAIVLLFLRWLLAALTSYVVLQAVPVGDSLGWLVVVSLAGLTSHICVVALLGDRDWLHRDFWSMHTQHSDKNNVQS